MGTVTRRKNKCAQQLEGEKHPRASVADILVLSDIYCENCKTTLGWKYEHAFESSQKYKEGKFIIELAHMIKDNGWE
ncbi:hypothetical protein INR49_003316 [Caranx melampygus]|nr:hypothetical protein INR49_003316 [Caranx melampygus]